MDGHMNEKPNQLPYITISPCYRSEYERFVDLELCNDEKIVAAVDFAENYFGRHPYLHWGFIIMTDFRFVKCYFEGEPPTALSYNKIGSRWRQWFYGETYEDHKWVVPSDIYSNNEQFNGPLHEHDFQFDLGEGLIPEGDCILQLKDGRIRLGEIRVYVCVDPERVEYTLTFQQDERYFVFYLLILMKHLYALKLAHSQGYISDEEFSNARKKHWLKLEEELESHLEWHADMKSLEEE